MRTLALLMFWVLSLSVAAQELVFVSDTQAPMWVEKLWLKPNRNTEATAMIFQDIIKRKPQYVFMLGDVVSLGYQDKKWKKVDAFLSQCQSGNIPVSALMGNHDVMTFARSGEKRFEARFKDHVAGGYVVTTDSVAVVLLNSNFSKMTKSEVDTEEGWLKTTLAALDKNPGVRVVVVACHHAPYSNSTIVGSNEEVQRRFVQPFLTAQKAKLFITGHSHNLEHFREKGKDFLVIGGGGGLTQPLRSDESSLPDLAEDSKPPFHYMVIRRNEHELVMQSIALDRNFSSFEAGYTFRIQY